MLSMLHRVHLTSFIFCGQLLTAGPSLAAHFLLTFKQAFFLRGSAVTSRAPENVSRIQILIRSRLKIQKTWCWGGRRVDMKRFKVARFVCVHVCHCEKTEYWWDQSMSQYCTSVSCFTQKLKKKKEPKASPSWNMRFIPFRFVFGLVLFSEDGWRNELCNAVFTHTAF